MAGELNDVFVGKDTGHDGIDISGEDPADIGNQLAFSQADFTGREIQCVAAQMPHGHIERHHRVAGSVSGRSCPGPSRAADGVVPASAPFLLQLHSEVQQLLQLLSQNSLKSSGSGARLGSSWMGKARPAGLRQYSIGGVSAGVGRRSDQDAGPPGRACMERVMGLEPTNSSLGSYCLTTWRHPHEGRIATKVHCN